MTANQFEHHLRETEERNQLLNFIAGGIKSPGFLVNMEYDSNNQIRKLLIINLDNIYKNELNFSDQEINDYYKKNIEEFSEDFRSIKYTNITSKSLTGEDEYKNSFFEKLDEIEDFISSNNNIDEISKKVDLKIETSKNEKCCIFIHFTMKK